MRPPRIRPSTVLYVLVAIAATAPAWIVKHPPLQDYPFHVATLRLIHSIHDASFGFDAVYRLTLFQTEYLFYYVLGDVLALFLGVKIASIGMVCLYLGGLPLGMRALLAALGRDERLCLFAVPLGVNVMFCFGLLPFVFGFPMMLFALAAAVRHFERPTLGRGVVLAVLLTLTFYSHVLPFAIFGVGCVALFPWTRPGRWLKAGAPLALGLLLVAWWILGSKAGGGAATNLRDTHPFASLGGCIAQLLDWSVHVFRDESDIRWFLLLGAVALAGLGLSIGDRDRGEPIGRGWFVVPLVCLAGYVTFGDMLGDVWMFGQRFALPLLLTCVPLLRMPRGGRGVFVTAALVLVACGATINVCKHFIEFEREEVGDIDDAIAAIEPRAKVAGLMYDRGSSTMTDHYAPFLHFVSYYQVERGGVVQFAYTGFPHWPVQYQDGQYPPLTYPKQRLRWEWTPEQVSMQELFPYYDYVLVRGHGFNPPAQMFHPVYRGSRWTVFERTGK